mmetsp:Transcript_28940/g.62897  ORF Transcript_28940/g.62897 Transcript_28940/m.62897 type:complete len:95 (+) Transcript_28940:4100-4384(+)
MYACLGVRELFIILFQKVPNNPTLEQRSFDTVYPPINASEEAARRNGFLTPCRAAWRPDDNVTKHGPESNINVPKRSLLATSAISCLYARCSEL